MNNNVALLVCYHEQQCGPLGMFTWTMMWPSMFNNMNNDVALLVRYHEQQCGLLDTLL